MFLMIVVAVVLIAAIAAAAAMRERPLYARLAAIAPERAILPRTSLEGRYRECRVERSDSTIADVACARGESAGGGEAAEVIQAAAERRLEKGPDADALYAQAMLHLLYGSGNPAQTAHAIANLGLVLPMARDSASVMVDLAAAHLVLAGQEQTLENLLEALDWSTRALELKPDDPRALFNRAVALESLTADIAASRAWNAFLQVTSRTGDTLWQGEARQRLRALAETRTVSTPALDASEAELDRFARDHPKEARDFGWNTLLGRWADTLLAGDTATAKNLLRRAEVVGVAVAERSHDAMLHDQVRAIRANRRGLREAARVQRIEAELKRVEMQFGPARAEALLQQLDTSSLTPAQESRLLIRRARTKLDGRELDSAARILEAAESKIDALRYPSLAARADWLRGTLLSQQGEYDRAAEAYRKAEAAYARLGEELTRGAVQQVLSDAEIQAGDPAAANVWLLRGGISLRPFGFSAARGYIIKGMAQEALRLNLLRAMRALADENVEMVDSAGPSVFRMEARLNRVTLLAAAGGDTAALKELEAIGSPETIEDPAARLFFVAAQAYARALAQLDDDPPAVIETAKILINYQGQELWRTRGFALAARGRLKAGDAEGAVRDLDSVFVALDHGRHNRGGAATRELVGGDVRPALLQLVRMLAQSDPRRALEVLERGSAALSSVDVGDTRLRRRVPDGRVVVRPLVLERELLIWTVTATGVDLSITRISPDDLHATIGNAATALLRDWDYEAHLTRLYGTVIRPVENRLKKDAELVFVHDADLGALPFAALRDPVGQYLIEKHLVWRAVSVAAASTTPDLASPDSAAFAAPKFDRRVNRGLDELPRARDEVTEVSRHYPHRLTAGANTPTTFMNALSRYPLVHFAGHAVVNNSRPERSHLVLEGEPGAPKGHLTAEQLEDLDLRHVRLVVLSACSTLGGDEGSVGFTGLSGALLGAGARGVVGSLWRVNDETTQRLMSIFHDRYRRQGNPMRALREAQIRMLRSSNPADSSPAAWAAFQYVGR